MTLDISTGEKRCTRCNEVKRLEFFYFEKRRRNGYRPECKECSNKRTAEYQTANSEKVAKTKKKYRMRPQAKEQRRWYVIKSRYKLTKEQYEAIVLLQNGVCFICEKPADPLYIDHDHSCCPTERTCGKCVRGLLCIRCNSSIDSLGPHLDRAKIYWNDFPARRITND